MRNARTAAGKSLVGLAAVALLAQSSVAGEPQSPRDLYAPTDAIERGLWLETDEIERDLRNSPLVIREPELNAYVQSVLCRTVGEGKCRNVRIYIVRTPQFNATMAPNGMMQIWTGLLLRTQDEAQLAAVFGHEFAHFEQRHSVRLFKDIKAKSDAAGFFGLLPFGFVVQAGLLASMFGFSREMEREADAGSLASMAAAGYDTREAARVWERLRAEMDATAAARQTKSRKDKNGGLFARTRRAPSVSRT